MSSFWDSLLKNVRNLKLFISIFTLWIDFRISKIFFQSFLCWGVCFLRGFWKISFFRFLRIIIRKIWSIFLLRNFLFFFWTLAFWSFANLSFFKFLSWLFSRWHWWFLIRLILFQIFWRFFVFKKRTYIFSLDWRSK